MLDPVLAGKMLRYTQVSNVLVKKALDALTPFQQDAEKAAAAREALIDHMIATGTIPEHEKEAAAKAMSSQEGLQHVLKNAIDKIATLQQNQKTAGDLGEGVDAGSLDLAGVGAPSANHNPNYLGARTSEKKASDVAMLRILEDPPA